MIQCSAKTIYMTLISPVLEDHVRWRSFCSSDYKTDQCSWDQKRRGTLTQYSSVLEWETHGLTRLKHRHINSIIR